MLRRPLILASAFTSLTLLAACGGSDTPSDGDSTAGMMTGNDGTTSSGSVNDGTTASSTSGTTGGASDGTTGSSSSGTTAGASDGSTTGSSNSGTTTGSDNSTTTGSGGSNATTSGQGNNANAGGSSDGSDTTTGTGNDMTDSGGATSGGSSNDSGGTTDAAGASAMGESGPDLDANNKANAAPGDMTSTVQDYLRLGEIRILNNNWGSAELNCNAPMSVFVNQDRTFGWNFNRGDCDMAGSNQNPDFPQIEFGIHPFGIGNSLATSPEFSSTVLLPRQIKDIQTASVNVQNMSANLQSENSWNLTFEFWISERDPVNDPNPGVYAEIMTFWGWQDGRWPAPPNGEGPTGSGSGTEVSSAGKTYTLWVQADDWADGQWRYFQFRANDGPQKSFNGSVDVKPFLDYLVNTRGYSSDFWVTRLEVGSEIDDNTQGTVQLSGISFEVNGETRSPVFAE